MDYAQQQRNPTKHLVGIVVVTAHDELDGMTLNAAGSIHGSDGALHARLRLRTDRGTD